MKIRRVFDTVERIDILEKSQQCLWSKSGSVALEYLSKQRCISEKVLKEFKVGFVPHSVSHQLRGRVTLPLFDPSGNLIAISARKIDDYEGPLLPPYWHESYEKGFYLYGLNTAIPFIRERKFVCICEGQFDVMQMHNHGFQNTVGLCSTNFSLIQYSVLNRYCEEMILILDKDANNAGNKGTRKALSDVLSFSCGSTLNAVDYSEYRYKFSFVEFEYNTDPDEFLRNHGAKAMKALIEPKLTKLRNNT